VKALSDGKLTENQRKVAEQSRILLGAFAEIGITALIDEATGYQKDLMSRDSYLYKGLETLTALIYNKGR